MKLITRIVLAALAFILVLSVTYIVSAFIAWDFNPGRWDDFGRVFTSIFGLMFSAIAAGKTMDLTKK